MVPDASAVEAGPQGEKTKPKLKKKVEEDNPFVSDDDKDERSKLPVKPTARTKLIAGANPTARAKPTAKAKPTVKAKPPARAKRVGAAKGKQKAESESEFDSEDPHSSDW